MRKAFIFFFVIIEIIMFVGCTEIKQAEATDLILLESLETIRPTETVETTKQAESDSPLLTNSPSPTEVVQTELTATETPQIVKTKLSAWIAYWDMDYVMNEAWDMGDSLDSIVFFAAYFDHKNRLFVPDEIDMLLEEYDLALFETLPYKYISIVNDKKNKNGSSSLKDVDLLYSLLSSDNAINKHVENLISLAVDGEYDGIEIDYERLRNDLLLWDHFIKFIKLLYVRTEQEGLRLRVTLEPNIPFDKIEFPEGPEYVMMCYNLHGSHSGPGPKADEEFIRDLVIKMEQLPGEKAFAFATGGFDWSDSGRVVSLTEASAVELLSDQSAIISRDQASKCAVFKYKDEDKNQHEVWYADNITLRYWIDIVKEYGDYPVAIWRLGGNDSLDILFDE